MSYIFISYSRRDKNKAQKIIQKIRDAGGKVWIDKSSIQAGTNWRLKITEAITGCNAFILLVSCQSGKSKHVLTELTLASKYNKIILPVFIDSKETPKKIEFYIANVQHINLFNHWNSGIQTLIQDLKHLNLIPKTRIFIAYSRKDSDRVQDISDKLSEKDYVVWTYDNKLIPGQYREEEIRRNVRKCNIFIACFSRQSISEGAHEQAEYKIALREYVKWSNTKNRKIYFIPLRLDNCEIPNLGRIQGKKSKGFHSIDFFEGVEDKIEQLQKAIDYTEISSRLDPAPGRIWILLLIVIVFLISSLSIIFLGRGQNIFPVCSNNPDYLSCGEKAHFTSYSVGVKIPKIEKVGRQQIAKGKYQRATDNLEEARKYNRQDPELIIALNNARIMRERKEGLIEPENVFAIAISTGFKELTPNILKSILTGVAARQYQFNQNSQYRLLVVMADDKHDKEQAIKVANKLIKRTQILGVIGPYSSEITYSVIDEYFGILPMVSATSTATVEAYQERDPKRIKVQDMSWFFRPVPTTQSGAIQIVEYLQNNHFEKVIIFPFKPELDAEQDLYAESFYQDLIDRLKASNQDNHSRKIEVKAVNYLELDERELSNEIESIKQTNIKHPDKIALVIISNAHNSPDTNSERLRALIIKKNAGMFEVIGNNTLFDKKLLGLAKSGSSIVAMPWHPSHNEKRKIRHILNSEDVGIEMDLDIDEELSSKEEPMRMWCIAMSYDATEMFLKAIEKQAFPRSKSIRQELRDTLDNDDFAAEGMTGPITLKDSDRVQPVSSLVHHQCSPDVNGDPGKCFWEKIKPRLETTAQK